MAEEITAEARELGVESVDCPECGKSLSRNELPDGGVSYGPCTSCFKKPTKTDIKEQAELQQAGVFNREVGTDTASDSEENN